MRLVYQYQDLICLQFFIIIANHNNSHWFGLLIYKKDFGFEVCIMDSLYYSNNIIRKKKIKSFLQELW